MLLRKVAYDLNTESKPCIAVIGLMIGYSHVNNHTISWYKPEFTDGYIDVFNCHCETCLVLFINILLGRSLYMYLQGCLNMKDKVRIILIFIYRYRYSVMKQWNVDGYYVSLINLTK